MWTGGGGGEGCHECGGGGEARRGRRGKGKEMRWRRDPGGTLVWGTTVVIAREIKTAVRISSTSSYNCLNFCVCQ